MDGKPWEYTLWDSIDIVDKGDITLGELIDYLEVRPTFEEPTSADGVLTLVR